MPRPTFVSLSGRCRRYLLRRLLGRHQRSQRHGPRRGVLRCNGRRARAGSLQRKHRRDDTLPAKGTAVREQAFQDHGVPQHLRRLHRQDGLLERRRRKILLLWRCLLYLPLALGLRLGLRLGVHGARGGLLSRLEGFLVVKLRQQLLAQVLQLGSLSHGALLPPGVAREENCSQVLHLHARGSNVCCVGCLRCIFGLTRLRPRSGGRWAEELQGQLQAFRGRRPTAQVREQSPGGDGARGVVATGAAGHRQELGLGLVLIAPQHPKEPTKQLIACFARLLGSGRGLPQGQPEEEFLAHRHVRVTSPRLLLQAPLL
mmetsp:Transcript_13079/g.34659  ORF Transcript_13079/g.34659 Transcript_13079/m.34659 type:complete len:315 (+) Transcript_13079:53-997(+)